MLQLLLERGQSYADLASLLGVDEAEVRARARAALTEVAGADPDRHVGLTDYLLGQADPIGRADAVRHLKDDPADLELATEVAQKIRLIAPDAELPRLPGEERRPRSRRQRGAASSRLPVPDRLRREPADEAPDGGPADVAMPPAQRTALSGRQTQLLVGLGSAAVLIVAIVLAVTGAFGGDDGGGTEATASDNPTGGGELARVSLRPQTGTDASGRVIFGLGSNASEPYVDLTLDGLEPPTRKQAYVLWLLFTRDQGYPVAVLRPCGASVPDPCLSENGSYRDRASFAPALLQLIERVRFVDVSIAPVAEVTAAVTAAAENREVVFTPPGTSVLRGAVAGPRGGGNAE